MLVSVGDRTEGAIFGALLKVGCNVLIPFGQNQPYDLVVDRGVAGFLRVQCKTGWERNDCVEFNSASTDHGHGHRSCVGRADVFGVYVPSLDEVLIVPVQAAAGRRTCLRLRAPANNQAKGIRFARDFVLERHAADLLPRPTRASAA